MPPKKGTEGSFTRQRPGLDWNKIVLNLALPVGGVLVALLIVLLILRKSRFCYRHDGEREK